MTDLAFLGPSGTFSHLAARQLSDGADLLPKSTAIEVIQAVESGECARGVIALENSLEGEITGSLDELLLATSECLIAAEAVVPVRFAVFRRAGDEEALEGVVSHPFALAQCSELITKRGWKTRDAASTAGACQDLERGVLPAGWGAIGPMGSEHLFELEAVEEDAGNSSDAATRFVLLAQDCPAPSGSDRSAFAVRPSRNEPGSLVRILQEFSSRRINLTSIKSRPTKRSLGDYVFYLECEGHIKDALVRDAVIALLAAGGEIRFLGSFPDGRESRADQAALNDGSASDEYELMTRRVRSQ